MFGVQQVSAALAPGDSLQVSVTMMSQFRQLISSLCTDGGLRIAQLPWRLVYYHANEQLGVQVFDQTECAGRQTCSTSPCSPSSEMDGKCNRNLGKDYICSVQSTI